MKSKIAFRAVSAFVVAVGGVSAVLAADSEAVGDRPWFGVLPVNEVDVPNTCEFFPSHLLGSADVQWEVPDSRFTAGVVRSFACGMQIDGYGHLYSDLAGCANAPTAISKSSSSFGTVTVRRIRAGAGHVPYMTLDWFPRFKAEAKVVQPAASCMVAGLMKGSCHELDDVEVCAAGGASVDGEARNENPKFKLKGVEFNLSGQSADDNTAAPSDAKHRERSIDAATAAFHCECTVKSVIPGSVLTDWTEECEAWIWDSYPELDLHGSCGQCGAYGYGTYGWIP